MLDWMEGDRVAKLCDELLRRGVPRQLVQPIESWLRVRYPKDVHLVVLDTYERDNLAWLLKAVVELAPFTHAHTGDWTCQVQHKLEELGADPAQANSSMDELARWVQWWKEQ